MEEEELDWDTTLHHEDCYAIVIVASLSTQMMTRKTCKWDMPQNKQSVSVNRKRTKKRRERRHQTACDEGNETVEMCRKRLHCFVVGMTWQGTSCIEKWLGRSSSRRPAKWDDLQRGANPPAAAATMECKKYHYLSQICNIVNVWAKVKLCKKLMFWDHDLIESMSGNNFRSWNRL